MAALKADARTVRDPDANPPHSDDEADADDAPVVVDDVAQGQRMARIAAALQRGAYVVDAGLIADALLRTQQR